MGAPFLTGGREKAGLSASGCNNVLAGYITKKGYFFQSMFLKIRV
jgi:hypothetical protein